MSDDMNFKEDNLMISAGDFRNGITVEIEGNVYQIIEFQHVKPGKGAVCLFPAVHVRFLLPFVVFR